MKKVDLVLLFLKKNLQRRQRRIHKSCGCCRGRSRWILKNQNRHKALKKGDMKLLLLLKMKMKIQCFWERLGWKKWKNHGICVWYDAIQAQEEGGR